MMIWGFSTNTKRKLPMKLCRSINSLRDNYCWVIHLGLTCQEHDILATCKIRKTRKERKKERKGREVGGTRERGREGSKQGRKEGRREGGKQGKKDERKEERHCQIIALTCSLEVELRRAHLHEIVGTKVDPRLTFSRACLGCKTDMGYFIQDTRFLLCQHDSIHR